MLNTPHHLATLAAALITLGPLSGTANAAITWNWSFNGEAGTFVTDGDLSGGSALPGVYQVTDFSVNQSAVGAPLGSMSGGGWNEGSQPGTGFTWDGSTDTQWFRNGGSLTNGANYFSADATTRVAFFPGSYKVADGPDDNTYSSSSTLNLAPAAVPEPSSLMLLSLCGLALGFRRKK